MTKKSEGRKLRDRHKAEQDTTLDATWNEVMDMYRSNHNLISSHAVISQTLLQNRELIAALPNIVTFEANIVSLTRDLDELKGELLAIHSSHADKSGAAKPGEDFMNALNIMNAYQLWCEKYNGVVLPTVNEIIGNITVAEQRLLEKKNALDVNVITDVEVKDVPVETTENATA
jgi:hypothetical protein